eukprot:m.233605 g.233605  ORF g.233605 m.233605 type:complete len:270 (-) comp12541_c0_seq1:147-956(-)
MVLLRREHDDGVVIEGTPLPMVGAVPFLMQASARNTPSRERKVRPQQTPKGRDASMARYSSVRHEHLQGKLGQRRQRRWDNLFALKAGLQTLIDVSAPTAGEDSVLPPSASAFTALFANPANMKLWESFEACSPEEQDLVLRLQGCHLGDADFAESVDLGSSPVHRYLRIERTIRTTLRRRHLPMGLFEQIETEIVSAFSADPDTVLVTAYGDSFSRLIQHGICQYLGLKSTSSDLDQRRITTIRNPSPELGFPLPPVMLSAIIAAAKS